MAEEDLIAVRKQKISELAARGVDSYPARVPRTHTSVEALAAGEGATVAVVGRMNTPRDMGKSQFVHLQDGAGRVQAYIKKDVVGEEAFNLFKKDMYAGDYLAVEGPMFKTKTGELTVDVRKLVVAAKALRAMPDKWHGLSDVELRYRSRHLDLISSPESREVFRKRSLIVSTIRGVMDKRGYIEVETPILLGQAGGASARPFETHHNALDQDMVLRIATELYLKRLIIGGYDKVYEIGRIFRNEGIDTRHNPEFTMMECYEAYSDYNGMADLFEELVGTCAENLKIDKVDFGGRVIDLKGPFKRESLPEMWKHHCGEPIENILSGKGFNRRALLALAGKVGAPAGEKTPGAKIFERIFDAKILPHCEQLTFVFDHPTAITPLAKLKPGTQGLVERFECFAVDQEFANAYSELNDPEDQRDRLKEQARQRAEEGDDEADILDEDFVQAMEAGMPPMGGMGVGIDRLVMLLTGQTSIRDVILFPTLKAAQPIDV